MKRWVKRHRFLLGAGLFLCFVFFVLWKTDGARGSCTEPVKAIVLEEKEKRTGRGGGGGGTHTPRVSYDTLVSYKVDGREHRGRLRDINQSLGVGNEVLIYYDPERMDKPYSVVLPYQLEQIQWQYSSAEGQIAFICISIVFVTIIALLANNMDKKREQRITEEQKIEKEKEESRSSGI